MSSFEVGESTDPIRWDGSGAELKHLLQQSKRYIQDLSSQQVIQWVGEKLPPSLSLLDYCAAPGGKSFGLTRLGYQVTASDLSEDRLATLQVNQERLGIALNGVYSQKDLKKQGMTYDGVWIDAPCSGSGTLQKNPDLKWNRTAKEIESLIYEQKRCVDSAVQYLKPKGYLIYSVCSLLPEEGAEAELWKDLDQTFDKIDELTLGLEKDEGEGFYIKILKKRN
jgi:16S rRNA (cytosine967-C5)-methyltransferase